MGCISIREIDRSHPKDELKYGSMNEIIQRQLQKAKAAKQRQMELIEKELRRYHRGGVDTSEEQDKVDIDDDEEFNPPKQSLSQSILSSKLNESSRLKRGASGTLNSSQQIKHSQSLSQNNINIQDQNQSKGSVIEYNSEDELEGFFGGTRAEKKTVKVTPEMFEIKQYKNPIFEQPVSDISEEYGNVFNDDSIDD